MWESCFGCIVHIVRYCHAKLRNGATSTVWQFWKHCAVTQFGTLTILGRPTEQFNKNITVMNNETWGKQKKEPGANCQSVEVSYCFKLRQDLIKMKLCRSLQTAGLKSKHYQVLQQLKAKYMFKVYINLHRLFGLTLCNECRITHL